MTFPVTKRKEKKKRDTDADGWKRFDLRAVYCMRLPKDTAIRRRLSFAEHCRDPRIKHTRSSTRSRFKKKKKKRGIRPPTQHPECFGVLICESLFGKIDTTGSGLWPFFISFLDKERYLAIEQDSIP
jgi:hypothetical protein